MKNSFNIYNASAGSGKTFTLVKEYLNLLFNSTKKDKYKNILAITFTNKAVGEMKERVIESLADFSKQETTRDNHPLFKAISEETGLTDETIRLRSIEILKSIIHNYAAFEISTIDGFTHRVLRTFAKDLGIPVNFQVELSLEEVLMEAVDALISKAGKDKELTRVMVNFTLSKTDEDKSWDISRDLFQISKLLINENNQKAISQLKGKTLKDFKEFGKKLENDIQTTGDVLKNSAAYFFELIRSNGIEEDDFNRSYVPKHFKKLQDGGSVNFEVKWADNISSAPLYPKKTEETKKPVMDKLQPEIAEIFETTKRAYFQIEFLTEIKKNLIQLSLLNEINHEVEAVKKERNLVLISEFNPKISEQVKDQPAPFIYERLGERYQHYFIDEFQDTSIMQWENLIPLISHNLSDTQSKSGLTIVGDAKQSIYRWRGGRAEQLIELSGSLNPFATEKQIVNLPDNYRSGSTVVNFNNDFFRFAANYLSNREYQKLFESSFQNPRKGEFGYVNISFLEAKNREEEFELYPEKVKSIIEDLDQKGFRRKDICILTRKRIEGVKIAEYLSMHGIPVVSSETLLLSKSPEVNLIVDLLGLSLNSQDLKLRLNIFNYLGDRYVEETEQYGVFNENILKNTESLFDWLTEYGIDFQLEQLKKLSLYEAAEYINRKFELVQDSNSYIQFFLDFVFETSQNTSNSLFNFLEIWEQKKDKLSIVVPESEHAVQIITIHKSKGLEFPVVIYPFANAEMHDTKNDSLWMDLNDDHIPVAYVSASKKMLNWNEQSAEQFQDLLHKNELDTLNILYVACTRASQQLYLLTNYHDKPKKSLNLTNLFSDYLKAAGKWNDNLVAEFGDPIPQPIKEKKENSNIIPNKFYSSATQNEAVKIVTRSGSLWDSRQQEAIEKGEIAHEILARINSAKDAEKAIDWAINNGLITSSSKQEISLLISGILSHPELKDFYSDGVTNFNEKEIINSSGERLRPDRINIKNGKATIIDYKTGGFVDKHTSQIQTYAQTLINMGYEVEKSILVYTNNPVIIKNV